MDDASVGKGKRNAGMDAISERGPLCYVTAHHGTLRREPGPRTFG